VSKENHNLRNTIVAGVAIAIILGILNVLWGWVGKLWDWFWSVVPIVWNFSLQLIAIPLWLLVALLVPTIYVLMLVVRAWLKSREPVGPQEPTVDDYTEDTFYAVTWRWKNWNGRPSGIGPLCPRDSTPLALNTYDSYLVCDACHTTYPVDTSSRERLGESVERLIQGKRISGKWREVVLRQLETESRKPPIT